MAALFWYFFPLSYLSSLEMDVNPKMEANLALRPCIAIIIYH